MIRTDILPRPISAGAILEWTRDNGLTEEEVDDLRYLVGEIEAEFSAIEAERRARP